MRGFFGLVGAHLHTADGVGEWFVLAYCRVWGMHMRSVPIVIVRCARLNIHSVPLILLEPYTEGGMDLAALNTGRLFGSGKAFTAGVSAADRPERNEEIERLLVQSSPCHPGECRTCVSRRAPGVRSRCRVK